jgi:hypothetical protein
VSCLLLLLCALQVPPNSSNSMAQSDSTLEVLSLVLAHDMRLAHNLYPVCQELATAVVYNCGRVRVDSVAELALLLDSPRWANSAQQRLGKLSLGGRPGAEDGAPACSFPALHVWVTTEVGAGLGRRKPKPRKIPKELEGLPCLAPKCPQLRVLHIDARRRLDWPGKSIAALAAAAGPAWPRLEHLGMECIRSEPLLAKAVQAPWQRLRHLDLSYNWLAFEAAKDLGAAAAGWPQLRFLDLSRNDFDSRSLQAIMQGAQHWPQLQVLRLTSNSKMRAKGAAAIAAAGQHWPQLTELSVSRCALGPEGAVALCSGAQWWPCLQRLHINFNKIGPEGARALAAAAVHWPDLQELEVRYNKIGRQGVRALEAAFQQSPCLTHRKLDGNGA